MEPIIVWDLPEDPGGNVAHIAEHGLTPEEVEDVIRDPDSEQDVSRATGRLMMFGTTSTGQFIAVVWDELDDDPWTIYPVTAYEVEDRY